MAILAFAVLTGCAVPRARISMQKIGPQNSIVGEPAEFTITVNNVGEGQAIEVVAQDSIPRDMSYVASSPTGRYDPAKSAVFWDLGTLQPGAGATLGVTLRPRAKGQQCNVARVDAAQDVRGTAQSCTTVKGLPKLQVSVHVSPEPVEVGFTTTYTVEVANRGSETATNVRVRVSIPYGLAYVSSSGPAAARVAGNTVSFEPLAVLPPNASVPYRILARALTPGSGSLEAQVGADHLAGPVHVDRTSRVSGDAGMRAGGLGPAGRSPASRTRLAGTDQIQRLISVENVLVRGRALTGRVVNRSARRLRDVYLTIRSVWLWDDEFKPGEDDPSVSVRFKIPGEVPAGGFLPFVYRPLPTPPRTDGHYQTLVSVAEFSEVP